MKTINKKPSLKALIETTNIPATLVRAVVRQMGGWESFVQAAPDITRHGIDGGFNRFIYNRDTEAFTRRNRAVILELAKAQADDMGENVIDMVFGFNCLSGGKSSVRPSSNHDEFMPVNSRSALARSENETLREAIAMALYAGKQAKDGENVLNALAWYAGEEVARAYCDAFDPQ